MALLNPAATLDRPLRSYREALLDRLEAEAQRRGADGGLFLNVYRYWGKASRKWLPDVQDFDTLEDAAADAAEGGGEGVYKYTLMVGSDGRVRRLYLADHGAAIIAEREQDERDEQRHVRGLAGYGRP